MKIDFTELYNAQSKLDKFIASNHNIDESKTANKRVLALLVELGELANETRVFKYWSLKAPSEKSITIEEYADGLHFILSLGNTLNQDKHITIDEAFNAIEDKEKMTMIFNDCFSLISSLQLNFTKENHELVFKKYLQLGFGLGYSKDDIFEAYNSKNNINHTRQKTNY